MGAVVTVRVKPGTDVASVRDRLQKILSNKTGEPVTVYVNISQSPDFTKGQGTQSSFLSNR